MSDPLNEIQEPSVTITRAQFWAAVKASTPLRIYFESCGGLVGGKLESFGKVDIGKHINALELARHLGLYEDWECL